MVFLNYPVFFLVCSWQLKTYGNVPICFDILQLYHFKALCTNKPSLITSCKECAKQPPKYVNEASLKALIILLALSLTTACTFFSLAIPNFEAYSPFVLHCVHSSKLLVLVVHVALQRHS